EFARSLGGPRTAASRVVEHDTVAVDGELELRGARGHAEQRELDAGGVVALPPQGAIAPGRETAIIVRQRCSSEPTSLADNVGHLARLQRHFEKSAREGDERCVSRNR